MDDLKAKARRLIREFKGDSYVFGLGVIDRAGDVASRLGRRVLLVEDPAAGPSGMLTGIKASLEAAGLEVIGECLGAAANAPVGDVERVRDEILAIGPDAAIGIGGGSALDALKGSIVLAALGGTCDDYFGVGKVSERLVETGKALLPMMAVQIAAASSAHLTKYANITNMETMQKKLFIDEAVVPPAAMFDYRATLSQPERLTKVGAFDGMCHLLEVYFGVPSSHPEAATLEGVARTGMELLVASLPGVVSEPSDEQLRQNIGLGTDLGGYAIMVGSTNGPHLNSFSMVDLMPHGQATALLLPYYTCFFAPAIPQKLIAIGAIYQEHGHIEKDVQLDALSGPELGKVVGQAMAALADSVGFPTTLIEVPGFSDEHVERMLTAAKDPSLESKLKGMPISLTANSVDKYMGAVLEAARTGDFDLIVPHEDYA
jgi:alcohol dehydrogenase